MAKPKVYLVGAGPGDAGLITVKGMEALKEADCVVYDFLANARLLEHAKKGAETLYVGKKGLHPRQGLRPRQGSAAKIISQAEINALIIKKARSGKTVVRLKGGDPFIFGRGGEEAEGLVRAGISFEVIPGVTSAIAAPAYAGIPLTHRELASSVTFITGHEDPLKERSSIAWDALSTGRGTLVFLMGWKNLAFIVRKLRENGWSADTPIALVRWGTLAKQQCVAGTLADIVRESARRGMKPPVVTVVGEVVRLREKLNWFEAKPLFNKRILVTRALPQAFEFTRLLEREGAQVITFPTIKTAPPPTWAKLDSAIKRLKDYDWAIFTSVNGVKYFKERLYKLGYDLRELKGVKVCAIGERTEEEIKALGIRVDLTPREYRAEAIISALGKRGIKGKRFLLSRALEAREILPQEIKRLGGRIDVAPAYKTVRPKKEAGELKKLLWEGKIDVITFTSSSTVTNFASLFKNKELPELLKNVQIACIGPVTADTARAHGMAVDIMPKRYTVPALAEAMAGYYQERKN